MCSQAQQHFTIPVWIPEGSANRVALLADHFELRWATSWRDTAQFLAPELGLPADLPVLSFESSKLEAIRSEMGDQPFAFVDDEIEFELRICRQEQRPTGRELLVNTNDQIGLTDAHVRVLIEFAEAVGAQ